MEILFENELVNYPIKFEYIGDGLELVALAGVTTGYCYKCELTSIDPNISRGEKWSRQPILLNVNKFTVGLRTLKFSSYYKD